MQHLNMEKLAGGAFSEQVNRAIEEVTMNIQDPNTDDKKVRKVTITLSFKPNAQRNFSTIGIDTKVSLAPTLGVVTAMSMGKDIKTGQVEAVEIGNQIPGQMSFVNTQPNLENVNVQSVDTDTGEIIGNTNQEENVIDLRRKQA